MRITIKILIATSFSFLFFQAFPQKKEPEKIYVSPELEANSTAMRVKLETQKWGKIFLMEVGPYSITESKNKGAKEKEKSNFWGTKSNIEKIGEFNFTLQDQSGNLCTVEALQKTSSSQTQAFQISEHFYLGSDEVTAYESALTVLVNTPEDSDPWLYYEGTIQDQNNNLVNQSSISSSDKILYLRETNSNLRGGKKRDVPAMGFEIIQDEKSIAAIQLQGPGLVGDNQYYIWLDNTMRDTQRLKITAVLLAIIQNRIQNMVY